MSGADTSSDAPTVAALIRDLAGASSGTSADTARLAGLIGSRFGLASRALERGTDLALLEAAEALWPRGWTPRAAVETVRRRVGPVGAQLVLDVIAADARRRPRTWEPQLAGIGAEGWWEPGRPLTEQWRTVRGRGAAEVLRTAVALVGTLQRLPALPRDVGLDPAEPGVDAKVLARVRALLAKAESTDYPEEAEALSGKAQELMGRHALDRAVVDAGSRREPSAGSLRLWLDAPYVSAKSSLAAQVAGANRCRAVSLASLDLVTVIGHPADLATVELLVTSLLVQADRAMLAAGPAGGSRTRSFRHAFLLSYATRIGERLREASEEAEQEAAQEAERAGGSLLPVLAARAEVVERTVAELFPRLTTRRFSVGNSAGWSAGRAAADAASLRPGHDRLTR